MTLNQKLLKRLIETPGVPGREERQREIAREELEVSGESKTKIRSGYSWDVAF